MPTSDNADGTPLKMAQDALVDSHPGQQNEVEDRGTTLPVFTPMQESLYLTLCGRALDNHLPHPILGDPMATQLVRKLGYDCGRFRLSASPILNIALRAKKLDEVARQFISRHPNAVGLDLGAGLDTRVVRIAPPPTVDWYDVDYPEVITARRQLLPARANAHTIGADLTDPTWLDAVPGRPAGGDRGRRPHGLPHPR